MSGTAERIAGDLVHEASGGDERALRRVLEHAYPLARRWALVQLGEAADADDVTQEVMVRIVRKLGTYHGDSSFESWLYAMTRNAVLDRVRRRKRSRALEADPRAVQGLVPQRPPSPDRDAETAEMGSLLHAFFNELPGRQREVFDLVELQGRSAADVATLLGIEPVSVRAHLFKARRTLRSRILDERPELAEELP